MIQKYANTKTQWEWIGFQLFQLASLLFTLWVFFFLFLVILHSLGVFARIHQTFFSLSLDFRYWEASSEKSRIKWWHTTKNQNKHENIRHNVEFPCFDWIIQYIFLNIGYLRSTAQYWNLELFLFWFTMGSDEVLFNSRKVCVAFDKIHCNTKEFELSAKINEFTQN